MRWSIVQFWNKDECAKRIVDERRKRILAEYTKRMIDEWKKRIRSERGQPDIEYQVKTIGLAQTTYRDNQAEYPRDGRALNEAARRAAGTKIPYVAGLVWGLQPRVLMMAEKLNVPVAEC